MLRRLNLIKGNPEAKNPGVITLSREYSKDVGHLSVWLQALATKLFLNQKKTEQTDSSGKVVYTCSGPSLSSVEKSNGHGKTWDPRAGLLYLYL